jgi:hypothetical protein
MASDRPLSFPFPLIPLPCTLERAGTLDEGPISRTTGRRRIHTEVKYVIACATLRAVLTFAWLRIEGQPTDEKSANLFFRGKECHQFLCVHILAIVFVSNIHRQADQSPTASLLPRLLFHSHHKLLFSWVAFFTFC